MYILPTDWHSISQDLMTEALLCFHASNIHCHVATNNNSSDRVHISMPGYQYRTLVPRKIFLPGSLNLGLEMY